jgi:hypothetical protein
MNGYVEQILKKLEQVDSSDYTKVREILIEFKRFLNLKKWNRKKLGEVDNGE